VTLYEAVGGDGFFADLVDRFYLGVAGDDALAPMYPEHAADRERPAAERFAGARHRLTLFLIQYWGGPTTYSDERGHPRLRMRHLPYRVGALERDRWLLHMFDAVDAVTAERIGDPELRTAVREQLVGYFRPGAEHLRNDTGLPITPAGFRNP